MASNGSDRPPVIGITTYLENATFGIWETEAAVLHRDYLDSIRVGGGNPVLLSPIGDWRPSTLDWLDGLVLSGGADVDPARYGQPPHPTTGTPQPLRDASEFALLAAAIEMDLPLLAVCRGLQVLNVALGGTLHQHTPEIVGTNDHLPHVASFGKTEISVTPGSLLGDILGESVSVLCHHHQSIDRVADGLHVVAHAQDGTVEALELPGRRFVVATQSHPEQNVDDTRLFTALVAAARARREGR
ncbi:gamma-glutamyl-gamma-aminobutyrate hydrolase family protein [Actinokineospora cianjurensis]|uniref:Anthranilate synthase component 2/putative glutamine amidotransferase n=1 Tax=Actinokineospora cianjurensis TaxID=585224 RepID=A0A421AWM0_9PSEU|nr:gamma-glutamyl-gamma-aminobutyrate hydrolase family protein [Actinokineospora cianjurensis]RLK54152.1 anthranilate synthase component 2/putative glutamine amidotransferase [Actinokineospora cianjurensis]